jgi:uncharacterized repeat protein (TIGR03803 family)
MRSKKPFSAAKPAFVIFLTLLLASAIVPTQAHARKFKVLHTFHGAPDDGAIPDSELLLDSAGNIYGTTDVGGRAKGTCPQGGCGTAFKMDEAGKMTWVYRFNAPKSNTTEAGLLRDKAGHLYGTTVLGGDTNCYSSGCGTVFRLNSAGTKETVLYKFTGTPDGWFPTAPLTEDASGNLYGTTYSGGASGYGTVFKLGATGKETILHSFAGPPSGGGDGALAYEGLTRDTAGNLYSVTLEGGAYGKGVVFKLDTTGSETLLYSFRGGSDGSYPNSELVPDSAGNLYGTTHEGGNGQCGGTGCGTVFKLTRGSGGNWTESILYVFCSRSNCDDGEYPQGLTLDAAGNVYGTTVFGGAYQNCNGEACGVVFKLDTAGKEAVLHNFTGGADGGGPGASVIRDSAGNLYGSTQVGGDPNCTIAGDSGCGVVFKLTP